MCDLCEAGLSITTLMNSKEHMNTVGKSTRVGDPISFQDLQNCMVPNKCTLPVIKPFQLFKKEVSCPDLTAEETGTAGHFLLPGEL